MKFESKITPIDPARRTMHVECTLTPEDSIDAAILAQWQCERCGAFAAEVCPDGYCPACHVSITFEDCCSGRERGAK